MEHLKALFENEGITEFAVIDFQKLSIINQRLIKTEEEIQSAIVMLIPYRHNGVELVDNYNVGLFARCMDYHLYARAARYLKAGGRLLYATCTVLKEENQKVVADFLTTHADFTSVPFCVGEHRAEEGMMTLLPHIHGTDGFFVAILEKTHS